MDDTNLTAYILILKSDSLLSSQAVEPIVFIYFLLVYNGTSRQEGQFVPIAEGVKMTQAVNNGQRDIMFNTSYVTQLYNLTR